MNPDSSPKKIGRWAHYILALLFGLGALFFVAGGAMLVLRGGSWYYLIAGLALLALTWGLVRGKTYVAPLYAVIFGATIAWSLWEAGLDFWPLFTRLFIFVVAGALLAFAVPSLRKNAGLAPQGTLYNVIGASLGVIAAGMFASTYKERPIQNAVAPTGKVAVTAETEQKNWDNYGSNAQGERFAALDQINRSNVGNLERAWVFNHGDTPISPGGVGQEDLVTPLQIGNEVFFCTSKNNVISLNATTGEQNWKTLIEVQNRHWSRCRGITYFDGTGTLPNRAQEGVAQRVGYQPNVSSNTSQCGRRIFTNTLDAELIAIDADTGEFCQDFGTNGRVNLKEGLGKVEVDRYKSTSIPTLAGDVVVVGAFVDDGFTTDTPSGVVRAFDVITGELRWAWDSGNPAVTGAPTEAVPYTRGSPNSWAPMSYDPETDTIFLPTGNHQVDLYGGNRDEQNAKYASSVVALNAADGRPRWSFQTVHHDLWDFDVAMQPTLTNFPKDGKQVPAVVFGTKAGMIFALDRATGEPLTKVEERPVPQSTLKGEKSSPTQPFSVELPHFGAEQLTEADMWGATPFDQLLCRLDFANLTNGGLFTPPSLERTLWYPGTLGGFNWGGVSVDPTANVMFVNDMRMGMVVKMAERTEGQTTVPVPPHLAMVGSPYYTVERGRFQSILGIPCQEPPFGTISAIDLTTKQIAWSIPAGTVQDTGPLGIKMGLQIPVGLPTIGGSMATQGGLLFFAATMDNYLRAYDSSTGEVLWKDRLPVGSQSTPISYKSSETGEQFVLLVAGGARGSNDRGDYVIAYKLKQ